MDGPDTLTNTPAATRQPKGDHNRRLSLGLSAPVFAAEAGLRLDTLKSYENTGPGQQFDARVARRVGVTLERLEAVLPNAQTGRRRIAPGVRPATLGQQPRPLLEEESGWLDQPRYGPGAGA